jgi:hypothetical protein
MSNAVKIIQKEALNISIEIPADGKRINLSQGPGTGITIEPSNIKTLVIALLQAESELMTPGSINTFRFSS